MSLLAVGTVAFDAIETPARSVTGVLGGSGTYITLAARYFSEPVALVAVVGHDFPQGYVTLLRERSIDLQGLAIDPLGNTFAWGGRYGCDPNQRETLFTHLNVLEGFQPEVPRVHRTCRILCLGNLDPDIQHAVLDQMAGPEVVVCDTMNYWIEHKAESLARLLQRVDCLIINDAEARQLADEPNLLSAAEKVRSMGPPILVLKKGEHGAMLFADEMLFVAPAYPVVEIQDPTGAGDTFMGGFGGCLARQERMDSDALKRAVLYGSVLASFGVERFGPERLLDLTNDAISKRLRTLRAIAAFPP